MKQIRGWELAHLFPLWVYVKPEVKLTLTFSAKFSEGDFYSIFVYWQQSFTGGALGELLEGYWALKGKDLKPPLILQKSNLALICC